MHETTEDLADLQRLLDASHAGAGDHLRSIIRAPERTMPAGELVEHLTGMRTLALSTVGPTCRPRVSAVDGHLLRGRWVFTTAASAVKARDLATRPAASAAYIEGQQIGVFTHGDVERLGFEHPDRGWVEAYLTGFYGTSPSTWGDDISYLRLLPRWMVGFRATPST